MESISEIIEKVANSPDQAIYLIISGILLIFALVFLRRVLQIVIILLVLIVLYYAWSYYSGNPVPVELPSTFSVDEIAMFLQKAFAYIADFLPKFPVGELVEGVVNSNTESN